MHGEVIPVRGKGLYVEIHGPADAPPVLYLHGGPGEGCYEFMAHQAKRLSRSLMLIGIDQRGVWRSEEIREEEHLSLDDLVEDCRELQKILAIEKWSVIGHSFGGMLGVLYALKDPDHIQCLVCEGPSFDFVLSVKSMLNKAAAVHEELGNDAMAAECRRMAGGSLPPAELFDAYLRLSRELGEHRMKIYAPGGIDNYAGVEEQFPRDALEEYRRKSNIHFQKLIREGAIFESLLPRLKELNVPVLLIKGKHDPVICDIQTEAFLRDVSGGTLILYEHCGHLPHCEDADRFAEDVASFILRPPGS